MKLMLEVCGNCRKASFQPYALKAQIHEADGCVNELCDECVAHLMERRDLYAPYEVKQRKVKNVQR